MRTHPVIHRLAAAAAMLFVAGCGARPVVSVANRSDAELRNVVLSGSGFSERIERLSAGAQHSFSPPVRGESSIRVAFDSGGKHHDSPEDTYFEAGQPYVVTIIIDPPFEVTVDAKLK